MKTIKVLGTGCTKCKKTYDLVKEVVQEVGIEANVVKVEEVPEFIKYQVMTTPGIVIDEKVMHSGSIPSRELVTEWFK